MGSTSKGALLLVGIVVIAFLVIEVAARAIIPKAPSLYIPSRNPRLIYELNPAHPQINSLGMRQPEFDLSNPPQDLVIAVIGDSHTYSANSPKRENAFPARLEHYLRTLTGKRVSVLNFGVPGYNMTQELEVLRTKVLPLSPHLVILQYCINDEHISNYIQPQHQWLNRAIHQSQLLSQLWIRFLYSGFGRKYVLPRVEREFPDLLLFVPGLVGTARAEEADPAHSPHPPRSKNQVPARYHDFIGPESLERDVLAFGEALRNAGIPGLATGFIGPGDRERYIAAGLTVYSFDEIFRGRNMKEYGYDPAHTNQHFNDSGSDLIGKALAEFIHPGSAASNATK